jgi:hypothetical protein
MRKSGRTWQPVSKKREQSQLQKCVNVCFINISVQLVEKFVNITLLFDTYTDSGI